MSTTTGWRNGNDESYDDGNGRSNDGWNGRDGDDESHDGKGRLRECICLVTRSITTSKSPAKHDSQGMLGGGLSSGAYGMPRYPPGGLFGDYGMGMGAMPGGMMGGTGTIMGGYGMNMGMPWGYLRDEL
ncbi:hypothetical protein I312_105395 [Cryptococcus bacillisporus CA1280]|uniref:uncharacterized protein n=1 Tax=Cryptococcus bacillisporus CA1280 TaxID=1296109 RepID=UPI003369576C